MTRARRTARLLSCCLAVVLIAASCGGSEDSNDAAPVSAVETDSTEIVTSTTERSVVTAETTSTTEPATTSSTTSTTEPSPADDLLRLAPARDDSGITFRWDRLTIEALGHSGLSEPIDLSPTGDLMNVVAVPNGGHAFQTTDNDRVIWMLEDGVADGLLVVPDNERLTLEGAGLDTTGEPIVLYQRLVLAEPENTRSTLLSHRLSDGVVTEIAVTGGWESGVGFPTLSPLGPGNGDVAVASWGAEGFEWLEILDLTAGDISFDSEDVNGLCFDGEPGCPSFWLAVPFGDDIVGMGPVWNDDLGLIDAFGLWLYDTESGDLELMQSWEWDNGTWYVEDMFVLNDSLLVVSLQDDPFRGDPLPPLFFDLVSGESWTLPEATFIRPAFLS